MSRQERTELLARTRAQAEEASLLPGDPSGSRELAEALKLIKGMFFQTTKCCATGTCG